MCVERKQFTFKFSKLKFSSVSAEVLKTNENISFVLQRKFTMFYVVVHLNLVIYIYECIRIEQIIHHKRRCRKQLEITFLFLKSTKSYFLSRNDYFQRNYM